MCRVQEDHGELRVEVIVLRDPQNPQGLARPRVLIPEKAAHGWWLQGKGKPTSCTATHRHGQRQRQRGVAEGAIGELEEGHARRGLQGSSLAVDAVAR